LTTGRCAWCKALDMLDEVIALIRPRARTQRVPKPMVQVIDRLAEVPVSSSWRQHVDVLQPVPNPVGQML